MLASRAAVRPSTPADIRDAPPAMPLPQDIVRGCTWDWPCAMPDSSPASSASGTLLAHRSPAGFQPAAEGKNIARNEHIYTHPHRYVFSYGQYWVNCKKDATEGMIDNAKESKQPHASQNQTGQPTYPNLPNPRNHSLANARLDAFSGHAKKNTGAQLE